VSRRVFVAVKTVTLAVAVAATAAVGSGVVQIETRLVFGTAPSTPLWEATLVWVLAAWVVIATTSVLSTFLPTMAAAGCAIGAYLLVSALTISSAISHYTFAGLITAPPAIVAGKGPGLVWPVLTGLLAFALLTALATLLFSRRDV
jgi:hypothetical protein